MKYRFIGKPDRVFPQLKTGVIYDLKITEHSRGLLGFLVGNTKPTIREPIACPYDSWWSFYQNWKLL